ncbi:F-box/FBD/LRR-repeat protein At5g53840, partial [Linum perenne]
MKKKQQASSKEKDDQISSLPDEILHEILDCLRSYKQAAKASLLSKRWNHLWLSHPILEFDHTNYFGNKPSKSTMNSFIAAAARKLSSSGLSYVKSVRIVSRDSAFIEATLNLIRNVEPEEIDMNTDLCTELVIPTQLFNSSRVRTLKLFGCKLLEDQYKMINLRMIHLSNVTIDHRVLNSMIAAAPLLEELTLMAIKYVKRLDVHMSLSRESVSRLRTLELVDCKLLEDQYKMINLRVVHLSRVSIDHRVLNSMIAAAPLLEKLTLICLYSSSKSFEFCNHANLKHLKIQNITLDVPDSIQIEVRALQSLESLSLSSLHCHDLEIICSSLLPSLKSLEIEYCHKLRGDVVNKLISKSPSLLSLRLSHIYEAKELKIESPTLEKLELDWYHWDPERVFRIDAPSLVHVRFRGHTHYLQEMSHAATNSFQAAQIRSSTFELSLYCDYIQNLEELKELLGKVTQQFQFVELQLLNINSVSNSKLINEVFMERNFHNCKKIACKCWRHQLKDVKIVNARDKDKEELIDISANVLSAFQ